ncbi:hypothetical protein P3T25_000734 [Paraburkholderia sp. GAS32]
MSRLAVIGRRVAPGLGHASISIRYTYGRLARRDLPSPRLGRVPPPPTRGMRFYKRGVAASTPPNNWLAQYNG